MKRNLLKNEFGGVKVILNLKKIREKLEKWC